jgi:hypothetical protein
MKNILSRFPFFLLLLPLFIVVHIEKQFFELYRYELMYSRLAFIFVAPIAAWGFFRLVAKNNRKAALLAFCTSMFIFYFNEVRYMMMRKFTGHFLSGYAFLLPVLLLVLAVFLYRVWRSNSNFRNTFLFVNTAFIFFILGDIALLASRRQLNQSLASKQTETVAPCDTCVKPDIYYLLFDCYTSSQMLKQEFKYDNSGVDRFLEEKGFRIIRNSKSNYNLTPFSMGSCFNMNYLKEVHINTDYYLRDYVPALKTVYNNQLFPLLEKEGYELVNHSVFNVKAHPTTLRLFDIWDIARLYDQYNFFKKTYMDLAFHLPRWLQFNVDENRGGEYARNRDRNDTMAYNHLMRTLKTNSSKPRFVYTHFLVPHTPFTFDSLGNRVGIRPMMTAEDEKMAYLQQTIYVNGIMKRVVDSIFAHAQKPLVIILQGDHGYRYNDMQQAEKEFPNLNAFYFYNKNYRLLNDSMSNVNTFRAVFNTFLGKQYPMLPNRQYFLQYK